MVAIKTSDTHPIRVDFVDHEKLNIPGKIGLTFAPGKKQQSAMTGQWDRDLDKDLSRLRAEYGTDLLVSLIEEHEFTHLGISMLREQVAAHGIRTLWFPIRDVSIPTSMEKFAIAVQEIHSALREGQTVVIHCMGGLGRTGLVAAACLVAAANLSPQEAIAEVRRARAGTIQTREQEKFISKFGEHLKTLTK